MFQKLTDALCASACALFMEMMHHEAGVRTVVVGGQPSYGPMQAPSGSRGAAYYTSTDIDLNINYTELINTTTASILPIRTDNDLFITRLGINLRDQIRKNEHIPLQFVYEAANCRIFYTPQTIYNYTNLWNYAANAIYSKPELCVQGSTGYATSNETDTRSPVNSNTALNADVWYNVSGIIRVSGDADGFNVPTGGRISDYGVPVRTTVLVDRSRSTNGRFNDRIEKRYQKKGVKFNNPCGPGDPFCGGTKVGPNNPELSLAPIPALSPRPAPPPRAV